MKFDDLPGLFPCMLSMHIDHLEVGAMTSVELRIWRVGDPVYFYQPDIFGFQVLPLNLPEECIRVIHSSHFSLIFHLFSTSFLNHFLKMKLKMNRKRIIFEKSNHALVCTKIVIFTFIFTLHFSNSFKLRSDMSSFAVTTTITHHHQPQSPPQCPTTALDVVWAPGKCFSLLMPH